MAMAFILIGCSTPYGIKDSFTKIYFSIILNREWCSTPYGIKDSFTTVILAFWLAFFRAQRLTASKIVSPAIQAMAADNKKKCSTPYGIKDSFTLQMNLQ